MAPLDFSSFCLVFSRICFLVTVFLTHSYENVFLLPLIPQASTWGFYFHPGCPSLLECLLRPATTFQTLSHSLLNFFSKQTPVQIWGASALISCNMFLVQVLSIAFTSSSSSVQPLLKSWPAPSPLWTTHTLHWHREGVRLLVSLVQFPHCALLSSHTHLLSPVSGRQEKPFYSACLHCPLQNSSLVVRSTTTKKPLPLSISSFREY